MTVEKSPLIFHVFFIQRPFHLFSKLSTFIPILYHPHFGTFLFPKICLSYGAKGAGIEVLGGLGGPSGMGNLLDDKGWRGNLW